MQAVPSSYSLSAVEGLLKTCGRTAEWPFVANRVSLAMAGLKSFPTVAGFATLTRSFAHVPNNPICTCADVGKSKLADVDHAPFMSVAAVLA